MQTVTYGLKLAIDHAVAFGKRLTDAFGLTPARFDLLHVLHAAAEKTAPRQRWFCEKLGLSAGTVARALKQLEQAGLVRRARNPDDARSKVTTFTQEGLRAIRRALCELQLDPSSWIVDATNLSRPFTMAVLLIAGFTDSRSLLAPDARSSLGYAAADPGTIVQEAPPPARQTSTCGGGDAFGIDDREKLLEPPRELLPGLGADGHVPELSSG